MRVVSAYRADSVIIVRMLESLFGLHVMAALCRMPVTCFVTGPVSFVKFVCAVLILTNLTKTVLVCINVSCLIFGSCVVTAGRVVPVIILIVGPLACVFVLVTVVPAANVTVSVIVFVNMACLVCYGCIVTAYSHVPVTFGIL